MRRTFVAVAVVAVVGVAGALVALSNRTSAGSHPSPSLQAPAAASPVAVTDDSAIGDSSAAPVVDLDGARRAAIAAVASTGEVMAAGMFSRRDVIARFATPPYAPQLTAETTGQVTGFLVALGANGVDSSQLSVMEAPIASRARADGLRAVVEVWSVLVVTVPGTSVAREAWRTVTLDMANVDGRWLVDRWASSPGPAPAPAPNADVADRADVVTRLGWSPTVAGGA